MDRNRTSNYKGYNKQFHKKRKRSKSRSISPNTKKSDDKNLKKNYTIENYKRELSRFLEEQLNIIHIDEFWIFYEKYQSARKFSHDTELITKNKLLNIDFSIQANILYDKLPVLDKHGQKLYLSKNIFNDFLFVIKTYQDFKQKSKFSKLKKLRMSQNDLPIAQYKEEIIEKLNKNRVILIAGNTGKYADVSLFCFHTYI